MRFLLDTRKNYGYNVIDRKNYGLAKKGRYEIMSSWCSDCVFHGVFRDMGASVDVCLREYDRDLERDARYHDERKSYCKYACTLDMVRHFMHVPACPYEENGGIEE